MERASLCSRMRCKLPSNTSSSISCIDYMLKPQHVSIIHHLQGGVPE
jgi:hypothetical protein